MAIYSGYLNWNTIGMLKKSLFFNQHNIICDSRSEPFTFTYRCCTLRLIPPAGVNTKVDGENLR